MRYGQITRLLPQHGYGFLVDDGGVEWFFLDADVRGGLQALWVDERVGFASKWTEKGPRAADIHFEQLD